MIIELIDYKEIEIDNTKKFEELIKNFNEISKNNKSKYRIFFTDDYEKLVLSKYIFVKLRFGNTIPNIFINLNNTGNSFYFEKGIDQEIFEEIKKILEELKLDESFLVEIIK
jgi:hypothetical protein